MLQQESPGDFVVVTRKSATVREFRDVVFSHIGLNWEKFVETNFKYLRPTKVETLIDGVAKAKRYLGFKAKTFWKPFAELIAEFNFKKI